MSTISITCSCGKAMRVSSQLEGKKVRCPACKSPVKVPEAEEEAVVAQAATEDDDVDLEAGVACPECSKEWPAGTIVCVACGYNFKTGKSLKTRIKFKEQKLFLGSNSLGTYTRFSITRDPNGHKRFTRQSFLFGIRWGSKTVDLNGYDAIATDHEDDHHGSFDKNRAPDAMYFTGLFGLRKTHYGEMYHLELNGPGKRPFPIWSGHSHDDFKKIIDLLGSAGLTANRKAGDNERVDNEGLQSFERPNSDLAWQAWVGGADGADYHVHVLTADQFYSVHGDQDESDAAWAEITSNPKRTDYKMILGARATRIRLADVTRVACGDASMAGSAVYLDYRDSAGVRRTFEAIGACNKKLFKLLRKRLDPKAPIRKEKAPASRRIKMPLVAMAAFAIVAFGASAGFGGLFSRRPTSVPFGWRDAAIVFAVIMSIPLAWLVIRLVFRPEYSYFEPRNVDN